MIFNDIPSEEKTLIEEFVLRLSNGKSYLCHSFFKNALLIPASFVSNPGF